MKVQTFITLCFLLFCFRIYAQGPAYKNYTTSEGLPSNNVYSAIQDDDGFMWFATDNGVSRFDGSHFKNFTTTDGLPDRSILNIIKDSSGRLWFLSFNGKISFYKNGKIYNSANDTFLKKINFSSTIAYLFEDSKKNIWISFNEHKTIRITPSGSIKVFSILGKYIWENIDGEVQMISNDGFSTFHGDSLTREKIPAGYNIISAKLLRGDSNMLVIGGVDKAIPGLINLKTNKLEIYNTENPSINIARNLYTDIENNIWFASTNGVVNYTLKDISNFPSSKNLYFKNKFITGVFQDKNKEYWFTSHGWGVFLVPSLYTKLFNANSGLVENNITSVLSTKSGTIIAGSQSGDVQVIENDVVKNPNESIIPINGEIIKLDIDIAGNVWILTDLAVIKQSKGKFIKVPDKTGFNKSILITQDDSIWIGMGAGLKKVVGDHIDIKYWGRLNRVYAIVQIRKNELWLGTDKGLYRYAQGKMTEESHGDSLLNKRINTLAVSADSALWVGTDNSGLIRIKNNEKTSYYSVKNGLSSNHCNNLLIRNNITYLATDNGLNILTNENNTEHINSYTLSNGLVSNHINQIIEKKDNTFLLATDNGIIEFDERTIPVPEFSKPYIDAVFVNDISREVENRFSLHYNENNIQIDFGAINFNTSHNDITFYYKLSGLDTGWNHTNAGSVKYNHLAPGNYMFSVKTGDSNGIINRQAAFFNIYIETPFWQTWWFRLLAAIAVVLLAGIIIKDRLAIYKRRINQQRKVAESELKALRAQINPHFIYNSLNSIQGFIMNNQKEDANIYLSKFAVLMRGILTHLRASAVTLAKEIESLQLYLELESFVHDEQFSFHFEVDEQIDTEEVLIPSMILQPYIENAIIHGLSTVKKGGQININFYRKNDVLICTITDNGIGRKRAAELRQQKTWKNHPSLGMQVTKERIDLLNMNGKEKIDLEISDLMDEHSNALGTRVCIQFPFVQSI